MLTIALAKGRIEKQFYQTLRDKKIINEEIEESRKLKININNNYEIILVKAKDVINLVNYGFADIGVVGSDVIEENYNENIVQILDLKKGICYFALATLKNISITDIKVIATKYPNIAKNLVMEMNIDCDLIKMEGSLEVAPLINYADAIIDLVETGNTLKANGLEVIKRFYPISTKIITRNDLLENLEVKKLIKKLK